MINQAYTTESKAELGGRRHDSGLDRLAAKIEELVRHNPDVRLDHGDDFIRVTPLSPTGLPVTLILADGRCTVALATWHDDFECVDLALSFVELAISGDLRVKVETVGAKPHAWTVERLMRDGTWAVESSMSAVRLFTWGRRAVHYLRNDWVPAPDILAFPPPIFASARMLHAVQAANTPERQWPL